MRKSTVLYCKRCLAAQWKCMVLVHKNRPIRKVGWNTNFWKSISNNSMELYHSKYIHFLHKDPYFAMSYNSGRVTRNTFCRPISLCEVIFSQDSRWFFCFVFPIWTTVDKDTNRCKYIFCSPEIYGKTEGWTTGGLFFCYLLYFTLDVKVMSIVRAF